MILIWMPVYNECANISSTLKTILSQSFTNFRLIISDNHSDDGTLGVIQNFAEKDSRIIIISPPNLLSGLSHINYIVENFLNKYNEFEYTVFVGGHDLWSNDYLQVLYERAELDDKPAIVFGDCYIINEEGVSRKNENIIQSSNIHTPFLPFNFLLGLNNSYIFNGLFRESLRKSIKLRQPCSAFDHLLIAEMSLRGKIVYQSGPILGQRFSSSYNKGWMGYVLKHLPLGMHNLPLEDFANQLEWVVSIIDQTFEHFPLNKNDQLLQSIKCSLLTAYIIRYVEQLSGFDNGFNQFFSDLHIKNLFSCQEKTLQNIIGFIKNNRSLHNLTDNFSIS